MEFDVGILKKSLTRQQRTLLAASLLCDNCVELMRGGQPPFILSGSAAPSSGLEAMVFAYVGADAHELRDLIEQIVLARVGVEKLRTVPLGTVAVAPSSKPKSNT